MHARPIACRIRLTREKAHLFRWSAPDRIRDERYHGEDIRTKIPMQRQGAKNLKDGNSWHSKG
ncbi:hypothetical protein HMPREF1155_0583 [Slackia sp. CM382]|nr:hypothetical protein HMPREF1155_0583 [Slackia sp. CM382]